MGAFAEARETFNLSTQGLLNLLARAGVTEAEARVGTIPDASQRWDRLLGRLNARFADGEAPSSPDPLRGFAESLERSLTSPARRGGPACQAGQAACRRGSPFARRAPQAGRSAAARDDAVGLGATSGAHPESGAHGCALARGTELGVHAPRSQRQTRAEPQAQAVQATAVSPGPQDMEDFWLPDPGSPTAGDLAFLSAEPFGPGHVGPSNTDPSNDLALTEQDLVISLDTGALDTLFRSAHARISLYDGAHARLGRMFTTNGSEDG